MWESALASPRNHTEHIKPHETNRFVGFFLGCMVERLYARPIRRCQANGSAAMFDRIGGYRGWPLMIVSDNGTEMTSNAILA